MLKYWETNGIIGGYLGDNFWSLGRTEDIGNRYVHLDNKDFEGFVDLVTSILNQKY